MRQPGFKLRDCSIGDRGYTMSQGSFDADLNIPGDAQEFESSIEDPVDYILPAKTF